LHPLLPQIGYAHNNLHIRTWTHIRICTPGRLAAPFTTRGPRSHTPESSSSVNDEAGDLSGPDAPPPPLALCQIHAVYFAEIQTIRCAQLVPAPARHPHPAEARPCCSHPPAYSPSNPCLSVRPSFLLFFCQSIYLSVGLTECLPVAIDHPGFHAFAMSQKTMVKQDCVCIIGPSKLSGAKMMQAHRSRSLTLNL
jgi:hypothetical protein